MSNIGNLLLAEAMLWLMYVVVAVAVAVTLLSAVRPFVVAPRERRSKRGWIVMAFTVLLLAATYAAGSARPMVVNGSMFTDAFWLKVADMLILSSAVLMLAALLFVAAGTAGIGRHIGRRTAAGRQKKAARPAGS